MGGVTIKNYLYDLCHAADIEKATDLDLLALAEECAVLEERVYAMLDRLSPGDRELLQDYLDTRNDLEQASLRAALRWGMQHPK